MEKNNSTIATPAYILVLLSELGVILFLANITNYFTNRVFLLYKISIYVN